MLIGFEGIDGAGKSTQAELLMQWIETTLGGSILPYLTKWNSSPLVKPAMKLAKKQHAITPHTFALLEAADLADRYDREIKPILEAGRIVVADRWVYTAFARGRSRNLDAAWLRGIYSFASTPDICFYLALPVDVALERILSERHLKFYEAGMDQSLSENAADSFREFQAVSTAAYNGLQLADRCFVMIDATASVEEQHRTIVAAVTAEVTASV